MVVNRCHFFLDMSLVWWYSFSRGKEGSFVEGEKKVRPSSWPLFELCPSSQAKAKHPVDEPSEPARLGEAVHLLCAEYIEKREHGGRNHDYEYMAEEYRCDQKELEILTIKAMNAVDGVFEHYGWVYRWQTEIKVASDISDGRADLVGYDVDGIPVVVVDLKTGRKQRDYMDQLRAYAYGLMFESAVAHEITMVIAWLRTGENEISMMTPEDAKAFKRRYDKLRNRIGKVWNPGEHCQYCKVRNTCDARVEAARSAAMVLGAPKALDVTRETLGELYPQAKLLEGLLSSYRAALRAEVMSGGPLPIAGGQELFIAEVGKDTIDAQTAWGVLVSELTEEQMSQCISVSKTSLMAAVSETAPRGKKKAAKDRIMELLRKAGAVTRTYSTRMESRKTTTN